MPTSVTLSIRGLSEATATVQRLGQTGQRIVQSALGKASHKTVSGLKGITPVRSGRLRAGWHFVFAGTYATVIKNSAPYFPFVEMGTGVIRPRSSRVLAFNVGSERVFAKFARGQSGREMLRRIDLTKFNQEVEKEIESRLRAAGLT